MELISGLHGNEKGFEWDTVMRREYKFTTEEGADLEFTISDCAINVIITMLDQKEAHFIPLSQESIKAFSRNLYNYVETILPK